jgi:hypothetical protein
MEIEAKFRIEGKQVFADLLRLASIGPFLLRAADVPEDQRSRLEVMRTGSASFKAVAEASRNRGGPWTKVAAGHVDLCNVPIPVRRQGS